jgi:hypothetical protein
MKINEIILESEELDEGWKSKLAGAALAGAAALGGGGAHAQSAQQPAQQVAMAQQSSASKASTQNTDALLSFAKQLGQANAINDLGWNRNGGMPDPDHVVDKSYDMFKNIYNSLSTSNPELASSLKDQYDSSFLNTRKRLYSTMTMMPMATNYKKLLGNKQMDHTLDDLNSLYQSLSTTR